ncbi:MAG TPA: IS1182 family transposase [Candidatus Tectomicrobia bacterium]|jgi:transposase
MSLRPHPIAPVPEATARIARAAFPKGNPYLTLRETLGTIFDDADFATLFPICGQPSLPSWRLALVTIMQFRENLADRHAAEAVRARIDWKYLLGLELDDPGFDFSVLSEFRDRLLAGHAEHQLLDTLLVHCRAVGLLKARGQQRTDATHVLAAVRALTRLELLGETFRATLNDLATVAPTWLQGIAPVAWYERYGKRIEDTRLPQAAAARTAYAEQVGSDGWFLLDTLDAVEVPQALRDRASVATLRQVWQQHFERLPDNAGPPGASGLRRVRLKASSDTPRAAHQVESPYDVDARYRRKGEASWIGYSVHLSETCDPTTPHLLTHVHTTPASMHEAMCTATIQQALVDKDCAPQEHVVDAAYVDAELLVSSQTTQGITLRGPARPNVNWQTKVEGAYTLADFAVDWKHQQVRCPQRKTSARWAERIHKSKPPYIQVRFSQQDCGTCSARARCTQAKHAARSIQLHPQDQWEALQAARAWYASAEGQAVYKCRAGIEGTLSQGVRAFGLRRARYRGLQKTHLQHLAITAAINVERIVAWLEERPRATTRTSRFALLAPLDTLSASRESL